MLYNVIRVRTLVREKFVGEFFGSGGLDGFAHAARLRKPAVLSPSVAQPSGVNAAKDWVDDLGFSLATCHILWAGAHCDSNIDGDVAMPMWTPNPDRGPRTWGNVTRPRVS